MALAFPDELVTLRDWWRWSISRFREAKLFFGHGCENAHDEAAWLILSALHLPPDRLDPYLDARLTLSERQRLFALIERRISERKPTAYLLNEAWQAGFRFYVDERVLIPRSYLAPLLVEGLAPWIQAPETIEDALDLCTGSGCLAILAAHAFPHAHVDATDLSEDALAVARRNVDDYHLAARIRLWQGDLFAPLRRRKYDLIISNPPYVTAESMRALPPEYRHEPEIALAGGKEGLDIVRRILREAKKHLKPKGLLIVEIGHNRTIIERAFPDLPFLWLDGDDGDNKVFLLHREDLP
ncbi:MAG: 50S ribosomal protein L3 N(5)-glutamine methyltransferase [Rhodocyclaceae bacterium]|nr:50S ribosomal protein L3 N(5)-glutamine methyltransferase [Rhodocyclaceae bacterium]